MSSRVPFGELRSAFFRRFLFAFQGLGLLSTLLLLLFLQPGAPCVYYGTEFGLCGGPEPACREAFPWDQPWAADLRPTIAGLADLRRNHPELTRGDLLWEPIGRDGLLGRTPGGCSVWVNRSTTTSIDVQSAGSVLWSCGTCDGQSLEPQSAAVYLQ